MTKEELKKEAEEYSQKICGYIRVELTQAYLASAEPREKRIAELEQENAELKGIKDVATLIRANNDTVTTLMQLNNKLVSKSQQLTKAKEHIENLLYYVKQCSCERSNYAELEHDIAEAEQFLKECDIDNAIQQVNEDLDFDKIADEMEQDLKESEVEK